MKRSTLAKVALPMMVALAATLGGTACAQTGKVIKMIPGGDLKIIDPIQNASYISRNHGYMVYDTLFSVDSKGQVKPQMIDTYTLSPDKKTYTFTLRQGLKWHDGAPVTAADCVASIKRWGAKDVSGTLVMRELASLDVVNERTFTLTLKEPFGRVIDALGKPSSNVPFMMPERIAKTDPNQQITDATGSGPFIFKKDEWVPGNKVVYVKNPNYVPRNEPADGLAGGKVVKVDRVEWIYIPDQNTALAALTNGEADIFELPQADFIPTLEKNPNIRLAADSLGNQGTASLAVVVQPPAGGGREALREPADRGVVGEADLGLLQARPAVPEDLGRTVDEHVGDTRLAQQRLQGPGAHDVAPQRRVHRQHRGVAHRMPRLAQRLRDAVRGQLSRGPRQALAHPLHDRVVRRPCHAAAPVGTAASRIPAAVLASGPRRPRTGPSPRSMDSSRPRCGGMQTTSGTPVAAATSAWAALEAEGPLNGQERSIVAALGERLRGIEAELARAR